MQPWESDFSGGVDEPDVPLPDSRSSGWIKSAS